MGTIIGDATSDFYLFSCHQFRGDFQYWFLWEGERTQASGIETPPKMGSQSSQSPPHPIPKGDLGIWTP